MILMLMLSSIARANPTQLLIDADDDAMTILARRSEQHWQLALEQARMEVDAGMIGPDQFISRAREILTENWGKQPRNSLTREEEILRAAAADAISRGPNAPSDAEPDATTHPGYRMYTNVRERRLRDTSPSSLVQHALDLAAGDPVGRDLILRDYYRWALYDRLQLLDQERRERIRQVEDAGPAHHDLSGMSMGEFPL